MSLKDTKAALFGGGGGGGYVPTPKPAPARPAAKKQPKGPVLSAVAKKAKIDEAVSTLAKAEGYLKKTMFQWSPDHCAAAPLYTAAAKMFQIAGEWVRARDTFILAAEHHDKAMVPSAAALDLMHAAEVALDADDFEVCLHVRVNSLHLPLSLRTDTHAPHSHTHTTFISHSLRL
jgi:hypothetical protein